MLQEAVILHSDRSTRYVSKFVLFHKMWQLERFQTAKATFKVTTMYLAPLNRYYHLFPKI